GGDLPQVRPYRGRRNPGRVQAADAAVRRRRRQHGVRARAPGIGSELHAHRDAGRPDHHGRVPGHSHAAVAAAPAHARHRDRTGGDHGRIFRRARHGQAAHSEPGGVEHAVVLRRIPARDLHVEQGEDGRVREFAVAQARRVRRCVRHRGAQRVAAHATGARLMPARAKGRKPATGSPHGEAARLPDLTAPVEDYLKAIYELERAGEPAATTDLAAQLGLTPASVTGMVRRLAEQGLLTHERYKGVRLTQKGRRGALRTLRRHRVIEAYLVHALGYGWDEVHVEAERLEHAATDALIDRMALAIGEPTVDPH